MRHFFRLAENVNVMQLMASIMWHPELWDADTTRTKLDNSPHVEAHDIILRFGNKNVTDLECWDRDAMQVLPEAKEMAIHLMGVVKGTRLGRVMVTKVEPGKKIEPHADEGEYAKYYTRYHIVLQGLPGSLFYCGDECVNMKSGDIWWFNSAAEHFVKNNSEDDRVHLIVDIRIDN